MSATLNLIRRHIRNPRKEFVQRHSQKWRFRFKRIFEFLNAGRIRERKKLAEDLDSDRLRFRLPREKGYFIFPENAFDEVAPILEFVKELVAEFEAGSGQEGEWTKSATGEPLKQHLNTTLFRAHLDDLKPDSPFLKFAIREDLLESISEYLGEVPRLNVIEVWYSRATDEENISSQLHHLDAEWTTQAKIFIYGSDVVEDGDGPLSFYDATTSQRMAQEIGYKAGDRATDDMLAQLERGNGLIRIKGKRGTVAMLDTAMNFHFGSRITNPDKPRIMVMFHYLPYLTYKKWYEFNSLTQEYHTLIQRLVLDSEGVPFTDFRGERY